MAFTATTTNSGAAWRPDVYTFAPQDVLADAAIITASTQAGVIEGDAPSVRVAYVTDDNAENVPEATEFAEAHPDLAEAVIHTTKIGQLVRVSREQYSQPGTAEQLAQSVARAISRKADLNFLTQTAPVAPAVAPAAGLLEWPGVINGGSVSGNLDALIDLVADLETNGAAPTHIILGPLGWAEARKWRVGTHYNQTLLGAGTSDAAPLLLGMPVIVNQAITGDAGLIIDRAAVLSAHGPINVATSLDRYFDSDAVALRASWRTGHTVPRPDRIGKFAIVPQGS